MNKVELEAYHNVQLHSYCTKINIEARSLEEIIHSMVMPAAIRYQTELADNIASLREIDMDDAIGYQKDTLKRVTRNVNAIREALEKLHKGFEKAHHCDDIRDEADILCHKVRPQMDAIREAADDLEAVVDDQYWPLVKYREMLFMR
jgi:glutamine synthetase